MPDIDFDMPHKQRIPILLLGDSPSGHSGLGRIIRDVALRIHEHMGDIFDVATLGLGAPPSPDLPFSQYPCAQAPDWVVSELPWVWRTHTKGRPGILLCMWDISRLLWLAHPEQCLDLTIRQFLLSEFTGKKWIYPAVDGAGPTGGLPILLKEALTKFDRVLNYTQFSAKITGYPDVATHGIDTSVFYPRSGARKAVDAKFSLALEDHESLIGIVATNQPRKDWALAFGTLSLFNQQGVKARVWIHTDTDMRHWDLKALYLDFGLHPNVKVFLTPYGLPDDDLAMLYSACDVTMGIGVEGFGFPAAESLCCRTPHVTGSYGGQADFVPSDYLIKPIASRYEGIFAVQRPVYDSADLARKVNIVLRDSGLTSGYRDVSPVCAWDDVWPVWEAWIKAGM